MTRSTSQNGPPDPAQHLRAGLASLPDAMPDAAWEDAARDLAARCPVPGGDLVRSARLSRQLAAARSEIARLRCITDVLPILVGFVDRDEIYRFASRSYETWLDRPMASIVGHSMRDVFGEDGYRQRAPHVRLALDGVETRLDVVICRRNDTPRTAELRYLPHRGVDGGLEGFHVVAVDVTERRLAEEELQGQKRALERHVAERTEAVGAISDQLQAEMLHRERTEDLLRQSQKMEAVGQLTGGIAHDFNNLLTTIGGSLDLLQMRTEQGRTDGVRRFVANAQAAAARAASLTHRLLAFSRQQTLDPRPTNINALVSSMLEMIERTVGPAISVGVALADDPWPILCDAHQMENALLNLCINARDAMPAGGRLVIGTAPLTVDAAVPGASDDNPDALQKGQYVVLSVSDTGTGMPPHVVARAFDPFFTTKPQGQGTGLGLSMIYGFARQSGGMAAIESAAGRGTTVRISLPRHWAAEDVPVHLPPLVRMTARSDARILVVDDEPAIRFLVQEVLQDFGCTVLDAATGEEALHTLLSDRDIDMLITDIGLPGGMTGRQLAEAVMPENPDLKVLFITGYAEATRDSHWLPAGTEILTKPFSIPTLTDRVMTMLRVADPGDREPA